MSTIAVSDITSSILRVSFSAEQTESPELAPRDWPAPTLLGSGGDGRVSIGEFEVEVEQGDDQRLVAVSRKGRLVQRIAAVSDRLRFDLGDSRIYGLGQGARAPMNRRGGIYDLASRG